RHVALSILYSFYNASRLAALGAVRALRGVHDLLAIRRFGDLGHFLNTLLLIHSLWRAAGTTAHKTGTSGGCGMEQQRAENPGGPAAEPQLTYFTTVPRHRENQR